MQIVFHFHLATEGKFYILGTEQKSSQGDFWNNAEKDAQVLHMDFSTFVVLLTEGSNLLKSYMLISKSFYLLRLKLLHTSCQQILARLGHNLSHIDLNAGCIAFISAFHIHLYK